MSVDSSILLGEIIQRLERIETQNRIIAQVIGQQMPAPSAFPKEEAALHALARIDPKAAMEASRQRTKEIAKRKRLEKEGNPLRLMKGER